MEEIRTVRAEHPIPIPACAPTSTLTRGSNARRVRIAALLLVAGAFTGGAAGADTSTVRVTVNARAGLASVPDTGIGVNHAVWDAELGTEAVSGLLQDRKS